MIDKIELIDEKVLFKLSDDMKIDVRELGSHGHRVVVIDNFYENPEMIRELALKSSYTSSTKVRYGAPIFRN
jgi:predicted HAD superfamily hydrolase